MKTSKNEAKTIAVTGAYGFLGNVIVRKLLNKGYRTNVLLHKTNNTLPEDRRIKIVRGDVRNISDLEALCKNTFAIIHCASFISIVNYQKKLLEEINFSGTKNVLEICKKLKLQKLVYIGSVEAIGKLHDNAHSEKEGFNPDHTLIPYGASKARASLEVTKFSSQFGKEHDCSVSIIAPSGIVGPFDNMSSDIGRMIQQYLKKKLLAYPSEGGFCFVDVRDVATAAILAAEKIKNREYYIISSEYVTVEKMMKQLEEITQISKPKLTIPLWLLYVVGVFFETWSRFFGGKPIFTTGSVRVLRSHLKVSSLKIKSELNLHPRSIFNSLKDQIKWYKGEIVSLE